MRWLHISDIHFGYKAATVTLMRQKLLEYVKQLEPVDCLFITGDLRYGKNSPDDYPPDTLEFIQALQNALNLPRKHIFIVPGNHDVNRNGTALGNLVSPELKNYTTSTGTIDDGTLQLVSFLRRPFSNLYRQIRGEDEPGWHYCIPFNDFNIICLNTAILCGSDGDDGNLIVGSELLNQLANTVDSTKPGIVLAHHDFDALRQDEQQRLELALKDMGATLYLCGHKHVALSRLQNTYDKQRDLSVLVCGANVNTDPIHEQTDMDFFEGEVNQSGRDGWVRAHKWFSRQSAWGYDQVFSMTQGNKNGVITLPLTNTGCTHSPYHSSANSKWKDIYEQYCVYIRNQCSDIEQNGLPMNAEDVQRRYALRRIFVPLSFSKQSGVTVPPPESDMPISYSGDVLRLLEEREKIWRFNSSNEYIDITLSELIPKEGSFRMFILSDPGGGKTTLLKWLASVYCFPEEYPEHERYLPNRELFPLWLRCRDIPEGRHTIWDSIKTAIKQSECFPSDDATALFLTNVKRHLESGTLLLLIDGLDEIGIESDRNHFVDQLRTFFDNHDKANIIVSSRPTGLSLVTRGKFPEFDLLNISPLSKSDILKLCTNWNMVVKTDPVEAKRSAEKLAKRITNNERIFKLACNPLLLTTLLLVERRVGRLPTKRADLYAEAIQVLLETWNRDPHEKYQPLNLNDSRVQLAYVAYHLMKNHEKQVSKSKLVALLKNAKNELSELLSDRIAPERFIKHIEERSSLLIQKGFIKSQTSGMMEPVYEFQHLTFQEYLAACAVCENCYPGANADHDSVSALIPNLLDTSMKEVIALAAVRLPRFTQDKLAQAVVDLLLSNNLSSQQYDHLRNMLQQFVADEVSLSADMIEKIIVICYAQTIWSSDQEYLRQILEGKHAEMLIALFTRIDAQRHNGYPHLSSMLTILSGGILNPYQYYLDHHNSHSTKERVDAILALSDSIWLDFPNALTSMSDELKDNLKNELFEFAVSNDLYVQKAALTALRMADFVKTGSDFSKYFRAFSNYINHNESIPKNVSIRSLPLSDKEKIVCDFDISEKALHTITNEIHISTELYVNDYDELLFLVLVAAIGCKKQASHLGSVFSMMKKYRTHFITLNPNENETFHDWESRQAKFLHTFVLRSDFPQDVKKIVQEYILHNDLEWAQRRIQTKKFFFYTDYSHTDDTIPTLYSFNIVSANEWPNDANGEELIQYIQSRLKEIECTT